MQTCSKCVYIALALLVAAGVAQAQPPAVSAISGAWSHNGTVTITGAGFGAKPTAAPAVWDDASGTDPAVKWDGAWPNCAGNAEFNLSYRTPAQARNIPLPHGNTSRYIAGAHNSATLAPDCGWSVILWKTRALTSFPAYSYVSWYQRAHDNWTFGSDDNYKVFAYSEGLGPYNLPNNWYAEYNPAPTSTTSSATWHLNDDALGTPFASLQRSDANGHSYWWDQAINPMAGAWTKVEMEIKYTNASDGHIKLWENGVLKVDYAGTTDNLPGAMRTEGVGGYARNYGFASNWRYFADVYLDYSRARVILGNAPTLDASTQREVQIPASWSDSSIGVSVNLGAFQPDQTAYLYVVNPNGEINAAGVPVQTEGTTVPPGAETIVFGPQTYTNVRGPVAESATFQVADPTGSHVLRLTSTGVSGLTLSVNGVDVLRPRDGREETAEVPVTLRGGSNTIALRFTGQRGRSVTVSIVRR